MFKLHLRLRKLQPFNMWFRSGNNNNTSHTPTPEVDVVDSAVNTLATDLQHINASGPASKFEKFRRSSLRHRNLTGQTPKSTRKRMKSPHLVLQSQSSCSSLKETDEMNNAEEKLIQVGSSKPQTIPHVSRPNKKSAKARETMPNSYPQHKGLDGKVSLKILKNSNPARTSSEFPKSAYNVSNNASAVNERKSCKPLIQGSTAIKTQSLSESDGNDNDDDEHDDLDSDTSEDDDDKDGKTSACNSQNNSSHSVKEKILLVDPKYRNNRVEKSSSKTKIDMDKRESVKRSRSNRKINTITVDHFDKAKPQNYSGKDTKAKVKAKKSSRTGSNLNLQTLVKFVLSNRKFLNTDEFALIRQRSISEAASSVMQVAATCKPMPIALKYPQDSMVAQTPKDHDPEAERNVVLVKKQTIKSSFDDNINCKDNKDNNNSDSAKPPISKEKKKNTFQNSTRRLSIGKTHRHSSDSSKSSGNYDDEAFYSCDEVDEQKLNNNEDLASVTEEKNKKASTPSLTSRMAAKINETTTNYRNRKAANKAAKNRKSFGGSASVADSPARPPYYKQLSFGEI
uniref:Uncharacterized protein n=1 Tax=Glossina palpalis gambiensis TaxID=67801 RepID=A0A1B0B2E1_9MUSC